jgi:GcrA cell cycle regulator
LPPLPSLAAAPTVAATMPVPTLARARNAPPAAPAPIRSLGTLVTPCCWPIGTPRSAGFRFCEADSVPGRPYCNEHCRDAYVRKRTAA